MAYQRFLKNSDYYRIITKQHFEETIRKDFNAPGQAEQIAEISIIENLIENYEIEETLAIGKRVAEYNRQITYPEGAYFWGVNEVDSATKIVEPYLVLKPIKCAQRPYMTPYWAEVEIDPSRIEEIDPYSQFNNYGVGDIVMYKSFYFQSLKRHGFSFNDIRQPKTINESTAWKYRNAMDWSGEAVELGEVVYVNGDFFALISLEDIDFSVTPAKGNNWAKIEPYDFSNNLYEIGEYVVYEGNPYQAVYNPNSETIVEGVNVVFNDPRNMNLIKHMVRLSLYELSKNLAPNMISQTKIQDYMDSMQWLRDCNKCKINPTIPRKKDEKGENATDWAIATFAKSYNPYDNPYQV